ncbi:MAG: MHYT domain-containing protein, partial [Longimicrobiales bacterium]
GVGIWSMHFVGMLAFEMPGMPIAYQITLVFLSVAIAILASALALFIVSRPTVSLSALLTAGLAMGAAISGMHYVGMWSMRIPAVMDWNPVVVAASILIAVVASFVALWLAFRYRLDRSGRARWIRIGGGIVMGFAISGMHYTAMAAVRFIPGAGQMPINAGEVLATRGLAVAVTGATLLILAVAIAGSAINRELGRRTAAAEESARLYRDAEAARREAEDLADELQNQAAHLEEQAAELADLNRELSAAEGRLRGIVDSALDAMIVADANSRVLEWNHHAETIFGWSADEAIGNSLSEMVIAPQHRDGYERAVRRYLATGAAPILNRRMEITALRRDRSEFPIEIAIAPVRTAGQVLFTAFVRDITEQKRAQEQLRESEKREQLIRTIELERSRLSILFEQAPAFIAVLQGPDHVFELTNARYDQLIGYRAIMGKPIREALPELEAQGFFDILDRVYETGEAYVGQGSRVLLQRAAGAQPEERYLNFVYQPFMGPNRTVSGIFVHGIDVSDLVRARQEAETGNRAKSDFLSRMSHELRTPLNAILGFGQLLDVDLENPENRESADQILKAGQHLLTLIDEVLDIARIEAGQISLTVDPVPVGVVLRESVDLVRLMADRQGITLRVPDLPAAEHFVRADRHRLKQVMLNLLSNAIKYNCRQGTVTLSCEPGPGDQLRLVVRDTGRGIPAGMLERLFTPFDRLGADQTAVEGTGLGLALSKGLVEAMGGRLGVESSEGKGSAFWVELPLVHGIREVAPAAEPAPARTEPPPPGRPQTVLLVEDNLANVRLMERLLQRRPQVKLITAMQGRLGLELAREHRPDLILLDLNLPDISGEKVLIEVRQDVELCDTPVVMISGDAIPSQVQRMRDLGARAYVTKPFNIQYFLRVLDESLQPED